jgi:hypothetical protein
MERVEGGNSFKIQARNQQGGKGKIEVNAENGVAVSKNLRLADIRKALESTGYAVVAGSLKQRPDGSWEMKVKSIGYKINIGKALAQDKAERAQDKAERAQAKFAGALERGLKAATPSIRETKVRETRPRETKADKREVSNEPKQPTSQPKSLIERAKETIEDMLPKPTRQVHEMRILSNKDYPLYGGEGFKDED